MFGARLLLPIHVKTIANSYQDRTLGASLQVVIAEVFMVEAPQGYYSSVPPMSK